VTGAALISAIDLCAYVGLFAVFLATANMLIGLMIAVRYSPVRFWPHRRINIFSLHNWTAYLLLASIAIHPLILLFVSRNRFRIFDIIVPLRSPLQPLENSIGAVGAYLLIIVVLTSYYRKQLGRHRWKLFHFLVYAAGILVFIHSVFTDPNLNGGPIDYLDGGKVFVFICLGLIFSASVWAWRFRIKKDLREREAHTGRYAEHESLTLGDD
jgi:methionine sulfoxide reductase heme-binding subunit